MRSPAGVVTYTKRLEHVVDVHRLCDNLYHAVAMLACDNVVREATAALLHPGSLAGRRQV